MKKLIRKKSTVFLIILASAISLFLHLYKFGEIPPCINADEAAYTYNAYSLLKTGKDEYGAFLPLRLTSFGDYKLPLLAYISIPFIALFGMNDVTTRLPNVILGVALVPLMYLVTRELFNNKKTSLVAAFLTALNPARYLLSRHAHEGVLSVFLVLLTLYFFLRFIKSKSGKDFLLTNVSLLGAAFSYHTGRLFLVFFAAAQLIVLLRRKSYRYVVVVIAILLIPFLVDIAYGANRVQRLAFYNEEGFHMRVDELRKDHPNRIIHNRGTHAPIELTHRYLMQFAPEFLVTDGDTNLRFGMPRLGVITVIEYVFILIGLYYLFKKKEQHRFLLLSLLLIAPLTSSLTWQDPSLIRLYTLIFIILIIVSYGVVEMAHELKKSRFGLFILTVLLLGYIFFAGFNWDRYLYHYVKRPEIPSAWQCGYKELGAYVRKNYDKFDRFVITRKQGQPYIYLLYYLQFDPASYQRHASLSAPDEFGFVQVQKFDKFDFNFTYKPVMKKTVFIGFPDEFDPSLIQGLPIKKITFEGRDIFWIVENN